MNKFVIFVALIGSTALSFSACNGQNAAHLTTETFKVWGNCGMCEKTIEKAAKTPGVAKADWNKDTKVMTVAFDSTRINLKQIQQNIAAAGYDNDGCTGDDTAYKNLHECCQYDRKQ